MPADTQDLNPQLRQAIEALVKLSGGRITINSGFRTEAQQAALYKADPSLAAPPGHSNHERGLAVDLGGDVALAHQLAPRLGLTFPMSWEPWHVELAGAHAQASPAAYTQSPFGDPNPTNDPLYTAQPDHVIATGVQAIRNLAMQTPGEGAVATPTMGVSDTGATATSGQGGGTGQAGTTGVVGPVPTKGQYNPDTWAHDFLTAGGFPTSPANVTALKAWMQAEGGLANNNPLNTTQGGYAGHTINSVGVMNYDNYGDSIKANLQALNNGRYENVIAALKQGTDPRAVGEAVAQSPWGTGQGVLNVLGSG